MEYRWNGEEWEVWDAREPLDDEDINSTFDPEQYEADYYTALNSEWVLATRTWEEWRKIESPMTPDDILDTVLFIRGLPSC